MSDMHCPPPLCTERVGGVVTVYGEVDVASRDLFAAVVRAVVEEAAALEALGGDAYLDLAGVGFIDVSGARVLVTAAAQLAPGLELVVKHPPAILVWTVRTCWGHVPGLRFEEPRGHRFARRSTRRAYATGRTMLPDVRVVK
jgi:anti-anti-sigma factor